MTGKAVVPRPSCIFHNCMCDPSFSSALLRDTLCACAVAGLDEDVQRLQQRWRVTESSGWRHVRRHQHVYYRVLEVHCRSVDLVAVCHLAAPRWASCRHHHAVVRQALPASGWYWHRVPVRQTSADDVVEVRWLRSNLVTAAVLLPFLSVCRSYNPLQFVTSDWPSPAEIKHMTKF